MSCTRVATCHGRRDAAPAGTTGSWEAAPAGLLVAARRRGSWAGQGRWLGAADGRCSPPGGACHAAVPVATAATTLVAVAPRGRRAAASVSRRDRRPPLSSRLHDSAQLRRHRASPTLTPRRCPEHYPPFLSGCSFPLPRNCFGFLSPMPAASAAAQACSQRLHHKRRWSGWAFTPSSRRPYPHSVVTRGAKGVVATAPHGSDTELTACVGGVRRPAYNCSAIEG